MNHICKYGKCFLGIVSHLLFLWRDKNNHPINGKNAPPSAEERHTLEENRGTFAKACEVQKHHFQGEVTEVLYDIDVLLWNQCKPVQGLTPSRKWHLFFNGMGGPSSYS